MDRLTSRPRAVALAGIAGSLVFASALEGCRDATEIELDISTDAICGEHRGTSITTGKLGDIEHEAPETATTTCTPSSDAAGERGGRIGSLVIVPSGDKDEKVAVRVVTGFGKSPEACIADGYMGGCIVARRSLRFQPHESIRLPIQMLADCLNVPCNATQTCVHGQCVSAEIPNPEECTEPGGCVPVDGGKDVAKDTDADSEGAGGAAGETGPEPLPEPAPEAGPEIGPEPEPEAGPEIEPEPEPMPEAGPEIEPEPEPVPEAGPEPEPEPEPEAGPEIEPEAGPDPEPEAGLDTSVPDDTGPDATPCPEGTADCDNDEVTGCEVTLASDPLNCGACGNDCLGGTCAASVCHPICSAGTADCDGIFANGCELNVAADPANCGACGRSCLGAACTASLCEPVVIATGQGTPTGIATDGVNVYFTNATNSGAVMRMPVDGSSAPVQLAPASNPFWVATDGVEVFWTAGKGSGGVYKANVDGTGLMTLASGQSSPKGLVIDSTHVFWVNQWGSLGKVRRDGTELMEPYWSGLPNPMFIAADVNVFVSDQGTNDTNGKITSGAKITTEPWEPLTNLSNPMGIAADSVAMYYVTRGTGNAYLNGEVVIYVYPTAHAIAGPIADGWGIAVDPDWVYWTSVGDGRLERVRRDATGRQVLISGLVEPRAIAVDSAAVYVASSGDGRILRIAR